MSAILHRDDDRVSQPLRGVRWELAGPSHLLSPSRYMGERTDLPPLAEVGAWCDVVLHDLEGGLRFRLVAVAAESDGGATPP